MINGVRRTLRGEAFYKDGCPHLRVHGPDPRPPAVAVPTATAVPTAAATPTTTLPRPFPVPLPGWSDDTDIPSWGHLRDRYFRAKEVAEAASLLDKRRKEMILIDQLVRERRELERQRLRPPRPHEVDLDASGPEDADPPAVRTAPSEC